MGCGMVFYLRVTKSIGIKSIGIQIHTNRVGGGNSVPVVGGSVAEIHRVVGEKLHLVYE